MTTKNKENKRINVEDEMFNMLNDQYKARKKEIKDEQSKANPNKIKRTITFVSENTKRMLSKNKEKKNIKVKQAPKGILAEHADELASAMKKARSKNELFQLARLMRKQSKEIQDIARKI